MSNKGIDLELSYYEKEKNEDIHHKSTFDQKIEKIKAERNLSTKRKVVLSVVVGVLAGALGYGMSFLIPDEDIRTNTINTSNEEKIFYSGNTKPAIITKDIKRAYTAEEIEAKYAFKFGKKNLEGISTRMANVATSPEIQTQYITNEDRDKNYIKKNLLTQSNLYQAIPDVTNGLVLNEVTSSYLRKKDFSRDAVYLANGTGNRTRLVDVDDLYIKKTAFSAGQFYLASGTNDKDKTISLVSIGDYWRKDSLPIEWVLVDRNANNNLQTTPATNSYFFRTDYGVGDLLLASGSSNTLTLSAAIGYVAISDILEDINKDEYIYIGDEDTDPTGLNISKTATSVDQKIYFVDRSRFKNLYYQLGSSSTIFDLINHFLPEGFKITEQDYQTIITGLGTKYKFRLWVGSKHTQSSIHLITNWDSNLNVNNFNASYDTLFPELIVPLTITTEGDNATHNLSFTHRRDVDSIRGFEVYRI